MCNNPQSWEPRATLRAFPRSKPLGRVGNWGGARALQTRKRVLDHRSRNLSVNCIVRLLARERPNCRRHSVSGLDLSRYLTRPPLFRILNISYSACVSLARDIRETRGSDRSRGSKGCFLLWANPDAAEQDRRARARNIPPREIKTETRAAGGSSRCCSGRLNNS